MPADSGAGLEHARDSDHLHARLQNRLAQVEADGLTRSLCPPSGIDLCSNDYLGLAQHPRLKQALAEAVLKEGCGSTGSRLLRGERACFTRVEQSFARFKGVERSLYFSSGYLANLAVLTAFSEPGDVIFSDERNHASLIDGVRLSRAKRVVFPHNDVEALALLLRNEKSTGQKFVVIESLFSMDGDEAPLVEYAALCRSADAALIVDEAHAVGIYGERGSGLIEAGDISENVFVSINTAGKALGVSGAFVAGAAVAIEYLIQHARPFIFSTAPPPAVAAALEASLTVIADEPKRRERLLSRARYLRARLDKPGMSQVIPIVIGENQRSVAIARELQQAGFDVRAIRPPTVPAGTARLRISVNQGLSESILDQLVDALHTAIEP
jgi:8-amino-7-oxononanoate synthase